MATFKICIFKHQKRKDGTYPVPISVFHKGEFAYIKTEFYASERQIKRRTFIKSGKKMESIEVKDPFILAELNTRITNYKDIRDKKLGLRINNYTAKDLVKYFEKETAPGTDTSIEFIEFARKHCKKIKKKTASGLLTAVNAMIDYTGRKSIYITEINAKFLEGLCEYLKHERTIKRVNQFGKLVTTTRKPVSDMGIFDYMTAIRTLFNAAKKEYNDEDRGEIRIKHYPFSKFKPKKPPEPDKRVLTVDQLQLIRNVNTLTDKRAILAKDVFLLSFYTAGMNLADLYSLKKSEHKGERFTYNRQKTRDRRQDMALISIKVFPEVLPYIDRYKGTETVFNFADRYINHETFQQNINKGLKKVAEKVNELIRLKHEKMVAELSPRPEIDESLLLPEKLSTYYARFTFATIAANYCGASLEEIDLCLAHQPAEHPMGNIYIKKDWSRVDNVIEKVIEYIKKGA